MILNYQLFKIGQLWQILRKLHFLQIKCQILLKLSHIMFSLCSGIPTGGENVSLMYADDLLLLPRNKRDLPAYLRSGQSVVYGIECDCEVSDYSLQT